jgi:hypothetical protein
VLASLNRGAPSSGPPLTRLVVIDSLLLGNTSVGPKARAAWACTPSPTKTHVSCSSSSTDFTVPPANPGRVGYGTRRPGCRLTTTDRPRRSVVPIGLRCSAYSLSTATSPASSLVMGCAPRSGSIGGCPLGPYPPPCRSSSPTARCSAPPCDRC